MEMVTYVGAMLVFALGLTWAVGGFDTDERKAVDAAKLEIRLSEAEAARDRLSRALEHERQTSHILRVINDLQKKECPQP